MYLLCFLLVSYVAYEANAGAPYPVYPLSDTDKTNIVKYHNFVRANWGTPALKNGNKISGWNDDIAANAAKWASGCVWQHSPQSSRQSTTTDAAGNPTWSWGENMAKASGFAGDTFPFATIASQVDGWKSEEANWDCTKTVFYDFNTGAFEDGCSKTPLKDGSIPMCGHFTQVAWAQTYEIGCALVDCPVGTVWADYRGQFFVCQYNPAGNFPGTHTLDPNQGTLAPDYSRMSDTWTNCPGGKPYYTTAAVQPLVAEDSGVAVQSSESHQSQDGIVVPMGGFVAIAVVCGLVVFLVILIVIAFIVLVSKRNNSQDMKTVSLL